MRLKPLSEQVVVVMGASSGIGREAALRMALAGAKVLVAARTESALLSLVEEIWRRGGVAEYVVADTSVPEQVQAVAKAAVRHWGRLDTWVQCAGIAMWARFDQTQPEEWQRVIDVNLNGTAYAAMAALPHLKDSGGGALLLVSSVEARVAPPLQAAYAASKHGINALARILRMELKSARVPVNVTEIMPSSINTPLFQKARTRIGVQPRPLPFIYDASLVVDAILFAAENPVPELIVGGSGKTFVQGERIVPRLTETVLMTLGQVMQRTSQPKSADAPDNLFEPIPDPACNQVEGIFGREARSTSAATWLQIHPKARRAIAAGLLGSAALLALRSMSRSNGGSALEVMDPQSQEEGRQAGISDYDEPDQEVPAPASVEGDQPGDRTGYTRLAA